MWNNSTQFFCPKTKSGQWNCPPNYINVFDERYTGNPSYIAFLIIVEGDAWHYRFYVPGDIQGMIQLFGGPKKFVEQLEEFVYRAEYDPFNALPNPYFWVGNEVCRLFLFITFFG